MNAKKRIQRTKTYQAGEGKHAAQDQQYGSQRTRDQVGQVKHDDNGSNDQPDDAVGIVHVTFHTIWFYTNLSRIFYHGSDFDHSPV